MKQNWKKASAQPSHADDWLITYADMITLLLCFFVVFLIISVPKKDMPRKAPYRQEETTTEAAPVHVPQPDPVPAVQLPDVFPNSQSFHKIQPEDFPPNTLAPTEETPPVTAELAPIVADKTPAAFAVSVKKENEATPIDASKASDKAINDAKGDRLTTIEMNSGAFFDRGSATLTSNGKVLLQNVANDLKDERYKDYQITVEGHTDDTPINTAQFPSNWELSTARASAVVHYFLDQGIAAQKLRAAGYADTFPKLPNRAANGTALPANQAQNRRVVIKLEKVEKEKQ